MKLQNLLLIVVIILFLSLGTIAASDDIETNGTTLKLSVDGQEATAVMINNPVSDEFLQLLPLDLELNDLYGREKYAQLPRTITGQASKTHTYEVGYVAYYQPTHSIAFYYDDDHEQISEGIVPIAIITNNTEIFRKNNTHVKIELV